MSKHTPGPWRVYGDDTNIFVGQTDSDNENACDGIRQVCEVKQGDYEIPDYDEAAANARLMAAAPDLLEALTALLWQHDHNDDVLCGMALQDARAAIAKATGEA